MTYETFDLWLAFAVGVFAGGFLGMVILALLCMARDKNEPDEHEGGHGI